MIARICGYAKLGDAWVHDRISGAAIVCGSGAPSGPLMAVCTHDFTFRYLTMQALSGATGSRQFGYIANLRARVHMIEPTPSDRARRIGRRGALINTRRQYSRFASAAPVCCGDCVQYMQHGSLRSGPLTVAGNIPCTGCGVFPCLCCSVRTLRVNARRRNLHILCAPTWHILEHLFETIVESASAKVVAPRACERTASPRKAAMPDQPNDGRPDVYRASSGPT